MNMNTSELDSITFSAYCEDGAEWWVFNNSMNGLFLIDTINWSAKFLLSIPQYGLFEKSLIKRIIKKNNKLFMIPELAEEIVVYNITDNSIEESISIFAKSSKHGQTKVSDIIIDKDQIHLIPQYLSQPYIIFNLVTYDIVFDTEWNETLLPYVRTANKCSIFNIVQYGTSIFFVLKDTNYFIEYDYINKKIDSKLIDNISNPFFSIGLADGKFWIALTDCSDIVKYDKSSSKYEIIKSNNCPNINCKPCYSMFAYAGDKLIMLPAYIDYFCFWDNESNNILKFCDWPQEYKKFSDERSLWPSTCQCRVNQNEIIVFPNGGNLLVIIDIEKRKIVGKKIDLPDECLEKLKLECLKERYKENQSRLVMEKDEDDLLLFMQLIKETGSGKRW